MRSGRVLMTGVTALVLSLGVVTMCAAEGFTNISEESGVAGVVQSHYGNVPKWWLSGMTLVDLDGDGDLDLHLAGHGCPAAAAFNDGKGRFTYVDPKLSIARGKRATNDIPYPGGEIRLAYDLNEDGKPDILCSWHDGGGAIYINDCKPGDPPAWNFKVNNLFDCFSRATAMADMNRDGTIDYLATSDSHNIFVLFGEPDGTFGKKKWSLEDLDEAGAIPVDLDGDGDLDYLASQRGYTPCVRRILLNDGKMNFTNVTKEAGLEETGSIMGGCDVDADGDADLVCVEGSDVVIYLNDGKGHFVKGEPVAGMGGVRSRPKTGNWGGAVLTDFNNDGLGDIIVNGKYFLYVLRGTGGGKFEFASSAWGLPSGIAPAVDEGLCFGDIDGDGDLVTFGKGPEGKKAGVAVFRNDLPNKHWLHVRPVGLKGNRAAVASTIRIYEAGGMGDAKKLLWYEPVTVWGRQSFHSYYTAAQTERHFGLGERTSVDVSVEFYPSGKKVEKRGVKADTTVEIHE